MRTRVAAAALFAWAALAASPARAEDGKKDAAPAAGVNAEEASRRFKAGVAFYKDKDFPAAMVEFKRAYELAPNYNVLFNLGQTSRELKDYAAALRAFDQYLREGGGKIPSARRKEVTTAVEELRRKVGRVKITTSVDGAEVAVDDVPAGVTPLPEPIVVNAGRRKLSAKASGYAPAQRVVDVASMEESAVSLDLTKIDGAPPRIEPPPPPPKAGPPLVAWVMLGTTGALALATGVTGGLAVSAHGSLKDALGVFPGDPKAISSAQSRTRTLAITTDVLFGVTAAAAVTTGVLFFALPRVSEKATVGVSPSGVLVRGTF